MPFIPATHAMRERSTTRQLWLFTGVFLLCLLAWDFSGQDMAVMHWLGDRNGFALRNHWWLEKVLHDKVQQLALLFYLGMFVQIWWPVGPYKQLHRWQRAEVFLGITWSLLAINVLKHHSLSSCPWDLSDFGGVAQYVSHWHWGLGDGGRGKCFPGGHASSALAYLALCMPWLTSKQSPRQHQGLCLLWAILLLGGVLGGVQTLRGAHYPSHTLWTAFICWTIAWLHHLAWARWFDPTPSPQT